VSGIIVTCRSTIAISRSLVCFTAAVACIPDARMQQNKRQWHILSDRGQRGQMFLPPDADNPDYATVSVQQCKCSRFSLPLEETKKTTEMSADRLATSDRRPVDFPYPEAGRRSCPPVAFPACVSTHAPQRRRPAVSCAYLPTMSTDCPAASDRGGRRLPGPSSPPIPSCPCRRSNSDHVGKRYVLGRNRESWELRLSTRECDFPGINIPNHYSALP